MLRVEFLAFVCSCLAKGVFSYWRPNCKSGYSVAWWSVSPYIFIENGTVDGVLPVIMQKMVNECCQKHVNLSYDAMVDNRVEAVEQVINGTSDFVLPLIVKSGKHKFLSFPLVPLVESPGIAFYGLAPLGTGESLIKIIVDASPMLVIMTLMVMVAGIVFWLVEERNETPIVPGIINGMWWAFVSMTTVGYGDISPKSKKGQIVAVIWILFGLVACSLFVAVVSSVLTMACLSQKLELRGNKIAVIEGGQEHSLAVRKSALPIGFSDVEEIVRSLEDGTSVGALLDSYVAGFHQDKFQEFRLNDIKEDLFTYGVVLMPTVMKYEKCFKEFLMSNHDFLSHVVSSNIIPLKKTTDESTAEEMSKNIFTFETVPTYIPLLIMLASLFVISCPFLLNDYIRKKRKNPSNKGLYDSTSAEERYLHEVHMKQLSDCLKQMHNEAEILQRICNKAAQNAETEAKIYGYENIVTVETCL
ncbi:uncharacterized protein LOC135682729 [Rhopilema esculentum]|uniref:uncharacterized protein LOC135682729 n=1 Tax=Rhopilema esculentum TaxID=499914 RepID=UPI0031DEACA3